MYAGSLIKELGTAVIGCNRGNALVFGDHTKNPSPLKAMAWYAVRKRMVTCKEEKSKKDKNMVVKSEMNTLINSMGDDTIPTHLKNYLKLEGFTAKLALQL